MANKTGMTIFPTLSAAVPKSVLCFSEVRQKAIARGCNVA